MEQYIDECVSSVVDQSYQNLEIILIDDGSTDKSGDICDIWAGKDSRIRVLHKENEGVSVSRNVGIDISMGEYIIFVDSDDVIHPCLAECLYNSIKNHKTSISKCRLFAFYDKIDKKNYRIQQISENTLSNEEYAYMFLSDFMAPYIYVHGTIFDRSIIGNTRFLPGKYNEDSLFISDLMKKGMNACYVDEELYYYRQRSNSIMAAREGKFYFDWIDSLIYQYDSLKDSFGEVYRSKLLCKELNRMSRIISEVYFFTDKGMARQLYRKWICIYDENRCYIVDNKEKNKTMLYRYLPSFYYLLIRKKIVKIREGYKQREYDEKNTKNP